MGLVRTIKKYNERQVANILNEMGYCWKNPKRRPKNIEKMVEGLPRCDLEAIVQKLKRYDAERIAEAKRARKAAKRRGG